LIDNKENIQTIYKQMQAYERIIELMKYLNLNKNSFSDEIGMSSNVTIGRIINEKRNPSKTTLEKIVNRFPQINYDWLKTGNGEMLKNDYETDEFDRDINYVHLLPLSAVAGSLNDFVVSIKGSDCEKIVSPIKGADWAITVSGDSMAPEFQAGSLILIKKINENAFIDWGKVYVLDTCNGTVIKILEPSAREGYIRCISINPDPRYAPFDVSFDDIYGVYRVMLCMAVK